MAIGVTVLASGSNGNCIAVHADGNTVLIDCGVSLRMLRARMAETGIPEASVRAILVTHRHDDHIKGVDKAAARFGVPVFTHYEAAQKMEEVFKKPVTTTILDVGAEFPLSGFMVTSFPVEHDAETVGFVLTKESSKVGIATDMGRATQAVEFNLRDSSTLVLESNYDMDMLAMSNRTWMLKQRICNGKGHLSNIQNSALLPRLLTVNTKNLILAHISHDCNQYKIAMDTAKKPLTDMRRQDVFLDCGRREGSIPTVWC